MDVGLGVGLAEGLEVGELVGDTVGLALGDSLGLALGEALGADDGTEEGICVGAKELYSPQIVARTATWQAQSKGDTSTTKVTDEPDLDELYLRGAG